MITGAAVARPAALVAVIAAGLLSGCSDGATPVTRAASPTPRPTATPTPTATTTTSPSQDLHRLARVAAHVSFAATYRAHQHSPAATQTWRVWRTTKSIRLDVVTRGAVTTVIVSPRGAFSCRNARHRRTCFRVAAAGRPVPSPFDLAPYTVFSADVVRLARHTDAYDVRAAAARRGIRRVPTARCFAVRSTARTPKPAVHAGTYCVAASGLVTAITYPSGNSVVLTAGNVGRPPAGRFRPYAKPTPLPS